MPARIHTLSGDAVQVTDEQLDELRMLFHGPIFVPGDPGYDDVRVVHNGMFDRRPGLIVQCSGVGDVVDAMNFARERDLVIAVRGGGHGVAGHCICDDGILIDLSAMRGVIVDPEKRRVRVQGGAVWGDVDRDAQAFGLVVPGGIISTTGVGGLTLGGGLGWLHRKFGLSIDSLRAVELVTVDGNVVRASDDENPDLFWGLRGAGANFGIATTFEFEAYPLGPIVFNGAAIYPAEDASEVFRAWRDWTGTVPDEITSRAVFWTMPADPHLPPEVHNRDVLITGAVYAGDPETGERVTQPIRQLGTPLVDLSGPTPYRVVQSLFDPFFPKGGMLSYWKSVFLGQLGDDAADLIVKHSSQRPHPLTLVHVPLMGGAAAQVPADATAFGDRSAPYMLSVDGNWTERADTEANKAWVNEVMSEAGFLATAAGTYLNFSGDGQLEPALRDAAFGPNVERLARLKKQYDPENRLRLNNNIPPAA